MGKIDSLLIANAVFKGDFDLHNLEIDKFDARGAKFGGEVRIRGCRFRHATFVGSEFEQTAKFGDVGFKERPSFMECTFRKTLKAGEKVADFMAPDGLAFDGCTFDEGAVFALGGSAGPASFANTSWGGPAWFEGIEHQGDLFFLGAHFETDLLLNETSLSGVLMLDGARFDGLCGLDGTSAGEFTLEGAKFAGAPELGEIKVAGRAFLDQAVFEQQVRLRIHAETMHCHRTIFLRGASISLAGDLVADGSFFPPPSDISGIVDEEGRLSPRIVSLRRADVAGLTISDLDLSGCLFAGAHHLERTRLGAGLVFGRPPGRWRSSRDVLAEEQWLRRVESPDGDWLDRDQILPLWFSLGEPLPAGLPLDPPCLPNAGSIADTYRNLRQAREEGKDSPGAASFYYGEMEMRRRVLRGFQPRDLAERAVLGTYWLLSGYGLRAWRSLATLFVLLLASSFLLWRFGFRLDGATLPHSARVAVASATSLVRPIDDSELNGFGFSVEIVLRFAGPALLALSALAVRARIKR